MTFIPDFPSPASAREAIAIQQELRRKVTIKNDFGSIETLAGVDVSYDLARNLTKAIIALFDAETKTLIKSVRATAPTDFPYISGLLSFREIPALLKAFRTLDAMPDLLMVDGQGVAHPRRLGIAAHLGVLLDIPAIGVAKSRLCGKHDILSGLPGEQAALIDKGEQIGTVLQSKARCNPLYISAGHKIDQPSALQITCDWLAGYRLPEPTRIADLLSKIKV